jgi:endo-1,4-beta-D-glucanase Y
MSLTSRPAASFAISAALLAASGCGQLFPSSASGAGGAQAPVGGTGGAPGPMMKDPSSYPQNTAGAMFPYPQGHAFANCTLPAYDTDKVAAAYNTWKTKFFMGGRVVRPENNNDTASEGIGYGMLIGVYMNDRPMFDTLWNYAHARLDGNGLMTWHYSSTGAIIEQGGATDADEDMAWALLMADKQWGGAPTMGSLPTYLSSATTLIGAIWSHEVDQAGGNVLKPGDMFGGANQTNPSYFAPSYYRVFARVTNNAGWMSVVTSSYAILTKASGTYGLVPNWVNSQGVGVAGPGNDANGVYFGYDACRTPWRIALDYCENQEPQALQYLEKIAGFYASKAVGSGFLIKDGYTVTGGAPAAPSTLGVNTAGMAFLGPGGVAAMDGMGHDGFVSSAYATLVADTTGPLMNASGIFNYFNGSWGVLSLLTMSGNFWNMTQ